MNTETKKSRQGNSQAKRKGCFGAVKQNREVYFGAELLAYFTRTKKHRTPTGVLCFFCVDKTLRTFTRIFCLQNMPRAPHSRSNESRKTIGGVRDEFKSFYPHYFFNLGFFHHFCQKNTLSKKLFPTILTPFF